MAIYRSSREAIKAYFDSNRVNQSLLKDLENGLEEFKKTQAKYNDNEGAIPEHLLFGGASDILLTGTEEEFLNEYKILYENIIPSDTLKTVIEQTYNIVKDRENVSDELSDYADILSLNDTLLNWYSNRKIETKVAGVIKDGSGYFKALVESKGKIILGEELYHRVLNYVEVVKTNSITAPYFNVDHISQQENVDYYYQFIIYFDEIVNGTRVQCKAMLDLLKVYKDDNGIIIALEPIDLKSTSKNLMFFPGEVKKWRYDIQAAWYTDALLNPTAVFMENKLLFGEGVEIKPFKFIVGSSVTPKNPAIFRVSPQLLDVGRNGKVVFSEEEGEESRPIQIKKGYHALLDDFEYYSRNNWERERIFEEGDVEGVFIDWNGIIQ